jgi:SAM-dependent methyltransferase
MQNATGEYTDWRLIEYKPVISELLPHSLLPYVSGEQTALDIGCNTGSASLFLAQHGLNVLGIDINAKAICIANGRAEQSGLYTRVRFIESDILYAQDIGLFDLVLMIRLLTCFSSLESWHLLLQEAHSKLKDKGLIYINDFKVADASEVYQERYDAGVRLGWRKGNFAVNDASGHLLFVAHHHSADEIDKIISPYSQVELNFHRSLSMNGNVVEMFEFIGRKMSD